MGEREHLSGIRKRNGSLAGGIEGGEEVDEEGDEAEVGGAGAGDQVAETGGEERPGHLREGEEEEGPAAVGVDRPYGFLLVWGVLDGRDL